MKKKIKKKMQRSQQNVLLMKILGLKNVRQWLWGSVDSNLPDWSPGYHTAGRGTVRGGSRSVPQRGMGGGTAPFPPVRSLQGWKEAWTLELSSKQFYHSYGTIYQWESVSQAFAANGTFRSSKLKIYTDKP